MPLYLTWTSLIPSHHLYLKPYVLNSCRWLGSSEGRFYTLTPMKPLNILVVISTTDSTATLIQDSVFKMRPHKTHVLASQKEWSKSRGTMSDTKDTEANLTDTKMKINRKGLWNWKYKHGSGETVWTKQWKHFTTLVHLFFLSLPMHSLGKNALAD